MKKVIMFTTGLSLFFTVLVDAEIFKWTDAEGKVHFGDKPPGKENVESLDVEAISKRGNHYQNATSSHTPSTKTTDDIYRNRRSDKVVMYTTSSCGYCAQARKHFIANNVSYVEKNITTSTQFDYEFKKIGGKGVPLIFMGDYQMSGFSVSGFSKKYAKFRTDNSYAAHKG